MKLLKRLLWRILAGIGVVWGTATLLFIALNITPGDTAITILGGPDALPTPAVIQQVRVEYGLNQPIYLQYYHYLLRLLHGNLGESYRLHVPIAHLISEQVGATAALTCSSMVLGVGAAIVIGLLTAKRGKILTFTLDVIELTASSIPVFILGLLLLLAFSFSLHLFPASSTHGWTSIILPTLTLAVPTAAIVSQVLRRELDDILEQPFITTARARGLSEAGVRLGHALRHAMIPILTISGGIFSTLISSAVVIETVFNRQGLGRLAADATTNRDVPLVLGVVLLATTINVVANIIVDITYAIIDPRIESK
jgi:peptide/nickel transport system permease protein